MDNSQANAGDSQTISAGVTESEADLPIGNPSSNGGAAGRNRGGTGIGAFFNMVICLAVVVIVIFLMFKLLKKKSGEPLAEDDTFMRKVSQIPLDLESRYRL